MSEHITFHFEGSLADEHCLNFYEAARFQYAAARLVVKLLQFRSIGNFAKKITNISNQNILLQTYQDGSFDISILVPALQAAQDMFIKTSATQLMSYVFERIVGKTSNTDVAGALNNQTSVLQTLGKIDDNNTTLINKALDIIQTDQGIKESLHSEARELLEGRIAELTREKEMANVQQELDKIDGGREQKLISMSAPLVSEMATTLRRSANTLSVISESGKSDGNVILFLNKKMAAEIEVSAVDDSITSILVDVIQYNKETGWGKARFQGVSIPVSFNVPSDIKARIQLQLVDGMNKDKVYLQTYFVRDKSHQPTRLIVVGILPTPVD